MIGKAFVRGREIDIFPTDKWTFEEFRIEKWEHTQVDGAYSCDEDHFDHLVWLLNETISNKKITLINSNGQ